MKYAFYVIAMLVGLSVSIFVLRIIMLPVSVVDRTLSTVQGTINKTLTADNAIYNYEWFKRQLQSIKAIESKIEIAQTQETSFVTSAGLRSTWSFDDRNEAARLASVKQGLQSQYQDVVAEYNARSQMATRNIFQDGLIPNIYEMGSSFLR